MPAARPAACSGTSRSSLSRPTARSSGASDRAPSPSRQSWSRPWSRRCPRADWLLRVGRDRVHQLLADLVAHRVLPVFHQLVEVTQRVAADDDAVAPVGELLL